jgi:hypothetical protein
MKSIRAGRGFGDSIYLQSVVRHLVATTGKSMRVATDYPDLFAAMKQHVDTFPFTRANIDITAHYVGRKMLPSTTQFEDMCLAAGIREHVELKLDWETGSPDLVKMVRAPGRPVVLVQLPRAPMGRSDGFGKELLPDCAQIQRALDVLKGKATLVQVGAGEPLHQFKRLDVDLANATTIRGLIDLASNADAFIGYPSFIVPLAESFNKPALIFWSSRGLASRTPFVAQITPRKVLHRDSKSRSLIDDASPGAIHNEASSLL